MGTLQQVERWSATHHPKWLVVLRVALGLSLFIKGISFLNNTIMMDQLLAGSVMSNSVDWLPLAITSAHLLGGFLIIIGLLTRWAVLFQIPILLGAVIFISRRQGITNSGSEMIFALVILILLFIFLIEGGGPISLDNYFKKHPV
ncbi:MAG: DoxX family protein [Bacteroidetes bacterium]|nr:MAG: DoxX family protein [Bacteroidota bacterium]